LTFNRIILTRLDHFSLLFWGHPATSGSAYDVDTLPSPSSIRLLPGNSTILPTNEVGCVTMATVTSADSRLVLPDAGVALMIPEGALKNGQLQKHYLAILREDRYRPKISGKITSSLIICASVSYLKASYF
jgi:ZU5 domain